MRRLAVVAAATAFALAGCGGSDEPTDVTPTQAEATADADGFTPDEREVADAAAAYYALINDFQGGDKTVDFESVLTADEAATVAPLIGAAFKSQKTLGESVYRPTDVTIDGDTASAVGCLDSSGTIKVPSNTPEDAITLPDPKGEGIVTTLPLTKTADGWRVSSVQATDEEKVPCSTAD